MIRLVLMCRVRGREPGTRAVHFIDNNPAIGVAILFFTIVVIVIVLFYPGHHVTEAVGRQPTLNDVVAVVIIHAKGNIIIV
jgi:hypothetical protein